MVVLPSISPELYFNKENTIEFMIPLKIAGILISIANEDYKPVCITENLLKTTNNSNCLNEKMIWNLNLLIEKSIIPNYSYVDFMMEVKETRLKEDELIGKFTEKSKLKFYDDEIKNNYQPKFVPLYRKNKKISFIYFYLEKITIYKTITILNNFQKILQNKEEKINRFFTIYEHPLLEINEKLRVVNFNEESLTLFPKIKKRGGERNFLDIWNSENKKKILNAFEIVKLLKKKEIFLFEEINNEIKKLKVIIINLNDDYSTEMNMLISIESLNTKNEVEKNLYRKSILLQVPNDLSHEIESNRNSFLTNYVKKTLHSFSLNEMYFIPFSENQEHYFIQTFSSMKKITITKEEYELYFNSFTPILKKTIKRIPFNSVSKLFNITTESDLEAGYLFGIPIYQGNNQIGVMIYHSEKMEIEIDESILLYSMTIIIYQLFISQEITS